MLNTFDESEIATKWFRDFQLSAKCYTTDCCIIKWNLSTQLNWDDVYGSDFIYIYSYGLSFKSHVNYCLIDMMLINMRTAQQTRKFTNSEF